MKEKLQIQAMLNGTETELINMSPVSNKRKRAEQDALRLNLKTQRSVLMWVLADNPPSASGAVTLETPKPGEIPESTTEESATKQTFEEEGAEGSAAVTMEKEKEEQKST